MNYALKRHKFQSNKAKKMPIFPKRNALFIYLDCKEVVTSQPLPVCMIRSIPTLTHTHVNHLLVKCLVKSGRSDHARAAVRGVFDW